MRLLTICVLLFVSFRGNADSCPVVPENLAKAISYHIASIRADEYCEARHLTGNARITIVIYTAEGACGGDVADEPGSCSVNWVRYMLGFYKGKILGPIAIGGKGSLTDNSIEVSENAVEIKGLVPGKNDPLCCPSVQASKFYSFSENGFKEILP